MLCGQLLYNEYITEFPNVVGSNGKINGALSTVDKDKFVTVATTIGSGFNPQTHKDKRAAKKELRLKARKSMGFIEYFLLRAIISWIIDKILSHYYG